MISTGAFLNEMDASNKQPTVAEKFAAVWEKKNAKAARAGGVSLMALSLAACGGSSSDSDASDNSGSSETSTDTLTVNTDNASGEVITSTPAYTPGGNDRVNTLQSEDIITGGAGASTQLNVTLGNDNDNGSDVVAPTMTGVEIVNIKSTASDGAVDVLDFDNVSDVTAISIQQALADSFVVRNISETATLSVSNVSDDATSIAFEFTDAYVAGTDSLEVTLDGFEGNQLNIGADANATTEGQNIENLTITASGDTSTVASLGSDDIAELTLKGDADLTISALTAGSSLLTIDASDADGATSITAGDAVENGRFTYTGGDGDDTLTVNNGGAVVQANDSLTGGLGADTLVIRPTTADDDVTAIGGGTGANASTVEFETLSLRSNDLGAADAVDFVVDMDHISGETSISVRSDDTTTAATYRFNDLGETDNVLTPINVNLASADGDGDADVTLDAKDGTGNESIAMTLAVTHDGHHLDIIDANANIESVSLDISGAYDAEVDFSGDFAGDTSNNGSITITGHEAGRTLTIDDNAIVAETLNMSGLASNASVVMGAATHTVTGGSGNDTIDFGTTLTAADTVDGGDGTDVLRTAPGAGWSGSVALTNIETLRMEASASLTARFSSADTVTSIDLDAGNAINSNVVTTTGLTALTSITATAETGTSLDDANGLTVSSGFAGSADELTLSINTVADTMTVGALTLAGLETLNIAVTGDSSSDNATVGGISATTGLTTVTVTTSGFAANATDHDVVLGTVGGNTTDAMALFDASTATSGVSVTLDSLKTGATVNLGSGGDDLTITGSSGTGLLINGGGGTDEINLTSTDGMVITTGTGDATIIFGTGSSNSVTLGTGDNVLDFDAAGAAGESDLNTITGFNSGDTFKLEDSADSAINVITTQQSSQIAEANFEADTLVFTLDASTTGAVYAAVTGIVDFTDVTDGGDVEVFIEAIAGDVDAAGVVGNFVFNDGTNSYLYHAAFADGTTTNTDEVATLDLVATFSGYIVNGTTDLVAGD